MKILMLLLSIVFVLSVSGQDSTKVKEKINSEESLRSRIQNIVGSQFPEFNIKTTDSTTFSNMSLENKVVFVNFWFAACHPCIEEMAGLNEMFSKLKDNTNFIFVSFTFDPDSTIMETKRKYDIKYRVIHIDQPECYRLNFNTGFPSNIILDKKGIVCYHNLVSLLSNQDKGDIMIDIYPKIIGKL